MAEKKEVAFIAMPFSADFREVYEDVIYPIIEKVGLYPLRVDEIHDNTDIVEDIEENIRKALIVVADLSTKNANVFYEVGFARALDKEVIMLKREGEDAPFDVRNRRYISYGTSRRQFKALEEALEKTLLTVIPRARRQEEGFRSSEKVAQELAEMRAEISRLRTTINEAAVLDVVDPPMPALHTARLNGKKSSCQSHLKQLALATMQYVANNNDRFPDADRWCDLLEPYLRGNGTLYTCPAGAGEEYGYAMNSALSKFHLDRSLDPSRTPLFFDSSVKERNASGGIDLLCQPGRHPIERNNVAFADGHVQEVDAETAKTLLWTPGAL